MSRAQFEPVARAAARRYGVDPEIFVKMIDAESGFQTGLVSPAGARGIAQIVPIWHPNVNPDDPYASLDYAARLLSQLVSQFGNYWFALAAYNAGPGAVQEYGGVPPYEETQNYVRKIMGRDYMSAPGPPRSGLVDNESYDGGPAISADTQLAIDSGGWWNAPWSQGYGPTTEVRDAGYTDPRTGEWHPHFNKGIDYAIPYGTPVAALVGGKVISVGDSGDGWDQSIKIQDSQGFIHNYGHLSRIYVQKGSIVGPLSVIGESGSGSPNTSSGAHLSYDVLAPSGYYVDPAGLFVGEGSGMAADPEYYTKYQRWNELDQRVRQHERDIQAWQAALAGDPTLPRPQFPLSPQEEMEWIALGEWIDNANAQYGVDSGPSPSEVIAAYDQWNANDPAAVDARNSANRYAREFAARQEAAGIASDRQLALQKQVEDSQASTQYFWEAASQGRRAPVPVPTPGKVPTGAELFAKALEEVKANMPVVTDEPYPTRIPPEEILKNRSTGSATPPIPTGGVSPEQQRAQRQGVTGTGTQVLPPGSYGAPGFIPGQPSGSLPEAANRRTVAQIQPPKKAPRTLSFGLRRRPTKFNGSVFAGVRAPEPLKLPLQEHFRKTR